jgi:hypothetical protein
MRVADEGPSAIYDRSSMMQNPTSAAARLPRAITLVAALVLIALGAASIVKGIDGRSTVSDSLKQEGVTGEPWFTPDKIVARGKALGFTDFTAPDCSVAGKAVTDGASARCFAQYMRVDALMATGGKTYSDMKAFVSKDGKLTDDFAKAKFVPGVGLVTNPARSVWVTETALTTALNASYMADQVSLFGMAVGGALLLIGFVLGGFSIAGARGAAGRESASARTAAFSA